MRNTTPAADVAFVADLMLCGADPASPERPLAELLNYLAANWDQLPTVLKDHTLAVATAHAPSRTGMPPRLQEALAIMDRRGTEHGHEGLRRP
ncbi:hypothetical protein [Streptomyces sp. NPDC001068]|uniref:hypothetical protein n=1 Tax=Streptomyces sp. NPDC001068 TaxID=3364544 RepID=UPI003689B5D5